jgi:Endonuclease NucS
MPDSTKIVLPPFWARFANRYASDLAYWYQPKGLAITSVAVKDRLKILQEFQGKPWRGCQAAYVKRLREEGISDAESSWEEGGAPLARMLKQVFVTLGFAWIDGDDNVEISNAGHSFLTSSAPDELLSLQALRYQFWNPSVGTKKAHGSIRVHPIPFLIRLFFTIEGQAISNEEYNLFVSRAKAIDDVENVADQIYAFRSLDLDVQKALTRKCLNYMLGGAKRKSIYNTVSLNRTYAYRMWALSDMVEHDNHGLKFVSRNYRGAARSYLERYSTEATYIDFASQKEFFAWMSDTSSFPLKTTALEIYIDRGDLESSILTQRSLGIAPKEINKFKKMLISEKTLEDNIDANLSIVGNAIGRTLKMIGRQYQTTVGPIDILAQDVSTDQYVVIELKKGRSADRVFGQVSRYMGWIRNNLADGQAVAGVIVAQSIDDKLRAAKAAHDTDIKLVRYSSQISAVLD